MDLSLGLRASVVSFADSLLAATALVATLAVRISIAAAMTHNATGLDRSFPDDETTNAIPRRYSLLVGGIYRCHPDASRSNTRVN
jgi:hypothetical protein